jgi:hypothetical protein
LAISRMLVPALPPSTAVNAFAFTLDSNDISGGRT